MLYEVKFLKVPSLNVDLLKNVLLQCQTTFMLVLNCSTEIKAFCCCPVLPCSMRGVLWSSKCMCLWSFVAIKAIK